jgi:DNA-binding response OmpR family regulator
VEADIRAARAAGAHDYWTKPIDFDHFARGMRELLARARRAGTPAAAD